MAGKPNPVQDQALQEVLASIAKASHFTREAWLELERSLPAVRQSCPSFYEAFTHLMLSAFQYHETMEDAGDDLLYSLKKAIDAPSAPKLPAPARS